MAELIAPWALAVATIMGEAGNEPFEGKLMVARVIRNRMRLGYTSDGSVAGTVFAPWQFSLWNTGDRGRIRAVKYDLENPKVQEAIRAWELSRVPDPRFESIVLYHAVPPIMKKLGLKIPSWARPNMRVATIGNHIFYTDKAALAKLAALKKKEEEEEEDGEAVRA